MKKIAVRPGKVQHPEVHTVCSDLYSWVTFDVRDTNNCSWPDLPKQPDCNSLMNSFEGAGRSERRPFSDITDQR